MVYLFVGGQEWFDTYFQHLPAPLWPGSVSNVVHAVRESIYFRQPGGWQKEYNTEYQCITTCRGSGQAFCIVDGRGAAVAGVAAAVNMEFCHTFIGS